MDIDVIGDIYGVNCSAEAVQTSHCILDRFFLFLFFLHKIIVPTLIFFVFEVFAGVHNNEYHHLRFHCTEIDSGVIHSVAKQRQLCDSDCVHIQYVVS